MSRYNLALILVTIGVIIYFLPILQEFSESSQHQLTGAIFAVGGVILWYLPGTKKK